jgi:predicted alpha/beta superfamily hydrolase
VTHVPGSRAVKAPAKAACPLPTLERHARFHSAFLADDRDFVVYLPPGYAADAARRYPVLYLHDGQNLFDPDTAYQKGQHWRVGETADRLIGDGHLDPLIIVGIDNTGTRRLSEYTPTADRRLGGGEADAYGRLIVEELKPFIDDRYRTLPGRLHTGLGGSSLGALVSLHLGLAYPSVFSRLALLSPSVWWDRRAILRTVRKARPRPALRIWLDMGTAEGRRGLDDARALRLALVRMGWKEGDDLHYSEHKGATHSEAAWAARVGPMLQYLYG